MAAATGVTRKDSGKGFIVSHGTSDTKEFNNLMTLTGDGTIKGIMVWEATLDAASLVDGAGESDTVACAGVALGDIVLGVSFSVDLAGITATPYVSAADVVTIRLQNESTGTVDLASCTVRVVVLDMT